MPSAPAHPVQLLVRGTAVPVGVAALALAALTLVWSLNRLDEGLGPFVVVVIGLVPVLFAGMRSVRAGVTGSGDLIERFLGHVDRTTAAERLRVEEGLERQARALERAGRAPRAEPVRADHGPT